MCQRIDKLKEAIHSNVLEREINGCKVETVLSIDLQYHIPEENDISCVDKWKQVSACLQVRVYDIANNVSRPIYINATFSIEYSCDDDIFIIKDTILSNL